MDTWWASTFRFQRDWRVRVKEEDVGGFIEASPRRRAIECGRGRWAFGGRENKSTQVLELKGLPYFTCDKLSLRELPQVLFVLFFGLTSVYRRDRQPGGFLRR